MSSVTERLHESYRRAIESYRAIPRRIQAHLRVAPAVPSRRMDAQALESEALAAAAAASSVDAVQAARVEFLGRKSALKQALRDVRDRETGMALNAVREQLEAAFDAREAELARADLDRRLAEESVDVTLPVGGWTRGHLHPITQIRRESEDIILS